MTLNPDTTYRIAFSHAPGIGPQTFRKLLHAFTHPKTAFTAPVSRLAPIINNKKTLYAFQKFRVRYKPHSKHLSMINKCIQVTTPESPYWPVALSTLSNIPICLYYQGDLELLNGSHPIVAIIGSRTPTLYGRKAASIFSKSLALNSVITLSGLAAGIDTIAHKIPLKHHKPTIAILGNGLSNPYPEQNLRLCRDLINHGGLALSEYPPDSPVRRENFPARNRIIAALADSVFVIQGGKTSGTRITSRLAVELGKDIFALPGPIDEPLSYTPNELIQQGAHLADSPEYILSYYGIFPNKTPASTKPTQSTAAPARTP